MYICPHLKICTHVYKSYNLLSVAIKRTQTLSFYCFQGLGPLYINYYSLQLFPPSLSNLPSTSHRKLLLIAYFLKEHSKLLKIIQCIYHRDLKSWQSDCMSIHLTFLYVPFQVPVCDDYSHALWIFGSHFVLPACIK